MGPLDASFCWLQNHKKKQLPSSLCTNQLNRNIDSGTSPETADAVVLLPTPSDCGFTAVLQVRQSHQLCPFLLFNSSETAPAQGDARLLIGTRAMCGEMLKHVLVGDRYPNAVKVKVQENFSSV
jgi:hypothetical protein